MKTSFFYFQNVHVSDIHKICSYKLHYMSYSACPLHFFALDSSDDYKSISTLLQYLLYNVNFVKLTVSLVKVKDLKSLHVWCKSVH